jgi:uncharacterized protein YxeA
MSVNTILLILLVIVNYSNFYLTHIHKKKFPPFVRRGNFVYRKSYDDWDVEV